MLLHETGFSSWSGELVAQHSSRRSATPWKKRSEVRQGEFTRGETSKRALFVSISNGLATTRGDGEYDILDMWLTGMNASWMGLS